MKILLLLSVLVVSACGMQGDLYLPDERPGDGSEGSANKISSKSSSRNVIQKT